MTKKNSENKITIEKYDRIISIRICPGCFEHTVVDVPRVIRSLDERTGREKIRYAGTYHACGSDSGHECWHMTKMTLSNVARLYEHFGPLARYDRSSTPIK